VLEAVKVVIHVATPALAVTAEQLFGAVIADPPLSNSTVPVGVPVPSPVALTVAVKVIDWPLPPGLADDTSAVALSALPTT
jgi:hypothetical protein